jgi:hypothetical protein
MFLLIHGDDGAIVIEDDAARGGRSLIDGGNVAVQG